MATARRAPFGSAALDLAYVAAGRYDGFWEFGLSAWDIAAGLLLVREAGGFVSDLAGGANMLDTGEIIAGNDKLHAELRRVLREATAHKRGAGNSPSSAKSPA